jgi:hypothetical protein
VMRTTASWVARLASVATPANTTYRMNIIARL